MLGVDPGLTRCGYAVLVRSGATVEARSLGVLTTPPSLGVPERLRMLAADIDELLDEVAPASVAMEQVFFQSNVRTAVAVAQASAVAMLAAATRGIPVVQYTPSQVKLAVTGSGTAGKSQVQAMVQAMAHAILGQRAEAKAAAERARRIAPGIPLPPELEALLGP